MTFLERREQMKLKLLVVTFLASITLVACNGSASEEGTTSQENPNIKEMVYNFSMRLVKDQSAVITPSQLIVEDSNGKDTVYDISDEDFLVSIAPYINKTHP